ncbi:Aspartate aminotransferase [Trichoderma ghanense]|uniref:Aspartate aminotransferase n=1 Tax=Trichoderma ghanense TaxID=65468 RepID=A0ABY2H6Z9_9HYPO
MAPPASSSSSSPSQPSSRITSQPKSHPQPRAKSSSSASSPPLARLHNIASHVSPAMASTTNFPPETVPQAPEDPLFGLARAYKADTSPIKVDLGIGAYRDNNAKPWVLPVVKKADDILRNNPELNHEYAPIAGLESFTSKAAELMLGADSPALVDRRATSVQTISGTGAVHLGALFLAKFYKGNRTVYVSNPTWANHHQIFNNVGITVAQYPYFNKETRGLDFEGMTAAISAAPERSIILLHPCAHNPTGVDPTPDQWKQLAGIIREKKHFPFFDCAYQGFASGDLARDASAVRYFVEQGFELVVAQSFAKNFGLYGERAGCFHFVGAPAADAAETVTRIASQLAILQRSEISNPPLYGARIASTVLNDPQLFSEWEENLKTMSGRIIDMRKALRSKLEELETPGTWNHITDQIGMFSFTGLTEAQVMKLREEYHIYMTKNGRISMAGLNTHNIDHVAQAIRKVVGETQ